MKLFSLLAVETGARCNRTCVFCPNHKTTRPDEYMDIKLIAMICEQLGDMKYSGRLAPYIYNEPMRDVRHMDILRIMRQWVPKARVMVSTNGDYLRSAAGITELLEAGVRQLVINIYSHANRHGQVQAWVDSLDVDQQGSPYGAMPLSAKPRVRIEAKYGEWRSSFELQNRSGNIDWFTKPVMQPLEKMCVRPWRALNINWKGEAVLCCNDYHGQVVVGSAWRESLLDIWYGKPLMQYRAMLLKKNRSAPLCDVCDYSGGAYPHMVDRSLK